MREWRRCWRISHDRRQNVSPDYTTYDPPGPGIKATAALCLCAVAVGLYWLGSCLL